jgi:hypothetical protein
LNGWKVESNYYYFAEDLENHFHANFTLADDDRFPLHLEVEVHWDGEVNPELFFEYYLDDSDYPSEYSGASDVETD